MALPKLEEIVVPKNPKSAKTFLKNLRNEFVLLIDKDGREDLYLAGNRWAQLGTYNSKLKRLNIAINRTGPYEMFLNDRSPSGLAYRHINVNPHEFESLPAKAHMDYITSSDERKINYLKKRGIPHKLNYDSVRLYKFSK